MLGRTARSTFRAGLLACYRDLARASNGEIVTLDVLTVRADVPFDSAALTMTL